MSDTDVQDKVYPSVKENLRRTFPDTSEIKILHYNLRRRQVEEGDYQSPQPATFAHIGRFPYCIQFLPTRTLNSNSNRFHDGIREDHGRRGIWREAFSASSDSEFLGNDWPLALCDSRTVDRNSDTVATDIIYTDGISENQRVYHNSQHKWYFVKDLTDNEMIMFLQTDSMSERGVIHASFENPETAIGAAPRASIEVRAFVFFE
ncbi:hypothetical protein DL98DRAFT_595996 [Cadophora sp. DSE1049]|nr:hypothetical protein DL98DRAFT_595996 [Cadophora sp. DSE1049]